MRCTMPRGLTRAINVKLSVSWAPARFPLGWGSTPEEVPPWDMSRRNGHLSRWADECLEDFMALPEPDRAAWRGELVREAELFLKPKAPPPDDSPNYPRLIRTWPGYSRGVLPVPDVVMEGPNVLKDWPPERPAYKGFLGLWGELKDRQSLREGIVRFAEAYSLLDPENGDTLDDWVRAVIRFQLIHRVATRLQVEASSPRQEWGRAVEDEAQAVVRLARRMLGRQSGVEVDQDGRFQRAYDGYLGRSPLRFPQGKLYRDRGSLEPVYNSDEHYFEWLWVHELQGALTAQPGGADPLHRLASGLLGMVSRQPGLELNPVPWGLKLKAGVETWAIFEYIQVLGGTHLRRCVVCGKPLQPGARGNALTCSPNCRAQKSARVAKARSLTRNGMSIREAAAAVDLDWRVLRDSLPRKVAQKVAQ